MNDPLGLVAGPHAIRPAPGSGVGGSSSTSTDFNAVLKAEMDRVNQLQEAAQIAAEDFASGKRDDIESVLFAARKADTAFKMLLQVRNKVLEAYEEVKQLRI